MRHIAQNQMKIRIIKPSRWDRDAKGLRNTWN